MRITAKAIKKKMMGIAAISEDNQMLPKGS
jgi:hypothetical protein